MMLLPANAAIVFLRDLEEFHPAVGSQQLAAVAQRNQKALVNRY
jgi:hypothetical protein